MTPDTFLTPRFDTPDTFLTPPFVENVGQISAENSGPTFSSPRYFQQEAETLKCGALATPVGFDWDGDGDMDILSGNTAGVIEVFENLSGPKVASPRWNRPVAIQVDGKKFRPVRLNSHKS